MNYIPAYFSFSFLESVFTKKKSDNPNSDELSKAQSHLDLLTLILDGVTIKTDVSKEKIEDVGKCNPYIKYLMKALRISSSKEDFFDITNNADAYFKSIKEPITLYGFSEMHHVMVDQYQAKSGYHCITPKSSCQELFIEPIETFKKDESKSWVFAKRFLEPHNSIIIADPYLFKEKTLASLKRLLVEILPINIKSIYHLTLIGCDDNKKNDLPTSQIINNRINELQEYMKKKLTNIVIESHIFNAEEFHDRYIITNNVLISPGYGLDILKSAKEDIKAAKDSTWIGLKPFKKRFINGVSGVFVFKTMFEKLFLMKSWIEKSSNRNSSNPLILLLNTKH